ncbi:ATP-binding protein [Helicobacter pylori]|uniref:ATP-binding protein n=1 Tax=Helicobacter pylori TaxID=210 RepID=UPI0011278C40|nr:ATP-binding protein [Helicobacter pylori]
MMILRAQTNFVKFLEQVLEVLKEVEIDKTECSTLLESIQKQQLVIPIVGNFSAGKSTLLNRVINLFKESIDKVFDRVSVFTWEKYKEENDDENDGEESYREFEEIKKMVLYFRDRSMFYLDCYDLSQEEIEEEEKNVDYSNEFLQLEFSLKNLLTLMEYRETNEEVYQESLNNEELQNDLREWRDLRNIPVETNRREFEYIKEIVLYFRDYWMFAVERSGSKSSQEELQKYKGFVNRNNKLLQLEFSLKNLLALREYRKTYEEVYQESLNNEELQNDLREWRRSKR